ncbi:unnamed protein product [Microthlaspi erraticum]|uniref:PWWP domain-containing protein n=1 Tax=Microthlaspi erraticum TaxID=1685480 RepID=A0A6D2J9W0_9BRAS|nr:unnamed protein product [Microthlaspi erraticum]
MSTEPGGVESDSDAIIGLNASSFGGGVAQTSETLADESLPVKLAGLEKRNGLRGLKRETDSVDGESDFGSEIEDDSDAESDDFREQRDLDGPRKQKRKLENEGGGVVLAEEDLNLSESDLVWGKVRSYPWWPGQVCDASAASKSAMKYFKKGTFLVSYFGDCSFAWNDVTMIKPFHQHFSEMDKQSNSPQFRDAVDCALEEVSRRVEFGFSCACVSEEAYNKLKTQHIINTGIREDSSVRYGGDKLSGATFFEPAKLVEYVKHLACFPIYEETDKLQLVTNEAQFLAFQQWKSYLRPEESAAPLASLLEPNTDEEMSSEKRKTDIKDNAEHKQSFASEDVTEEKRSDIVANKVFESGSVEKSHSGKKRKSEKNSDEENNSSVGNKLQKVAEPCFRIGVVPLRMESVMSSSTPAVKPCGDSKTASKVEVENKPKHEEISSPDEMLSSIHSAKEIPESFSLDHSNYQDFEKFITETSCTSLNLDSEKASITETSETWNVKDSSDEMLSNPHNAKGGKEIPESMSVDPSDYEDIEKFIEELSCSNVSDVKVSSEQQILPVKEYITGSGSEEQTGLKDCSADSSAPNALILKFADSGSVPSEEKLNSIFNRYGPLRESETQIMKKGKRAKVVFKRGEDAKTAFSSSGKYSTFGPSLLSYSLKYVCPKAKQSNKLTN